MVLPFDDRPLLTLGGIYHVHSTRHDVPFHWCGLAVGLHPVSVDGRLHLFLRALRTDSGGWLVVDVRHLVPDLADDIPRHVASDHRGLVYFSLRAHWQTRDGFLIAADRQALWRSPADAEQLQEAA